MFSLVHSMKLLVKIPTSRERKKVKIHNSLNILYLRNSYDFGLSQELHNILHFTIFRSAALLPENKCSLGSLIFKLKALSNFKRPNSSWINGKHDNNFSNFDCTTTTFMGNSFTNSFQPFSGAVNWESSLNQFKCHPFRNWLKLCSSFNLRATYKNLPEHA